MDPTNPHGLPRKRFGANQAVQIAPVGFDRMCMYLNQDRFAYRPARIVFATPDHGDSYLVEFDDGKRDIIHVQRIEPAG